MVPDPQPARAELTALLFGEIRESGRNLFVDGEAVPGPSVIPEQPDALDHGGAPFVVHLPSIGPYSLAP